MTYTGSTAVLNLFLETVFGVSSIPSLQPFQILQIKKELQGIQKKVKLLNNGKCKAALQFFNRGEYEEAKKASIEGLNTAADIDTKVTATRTKILSELILLFKKESNNIVFQAGKIIRMCLDELLDDSLTKECWKTVRNYEKIKGVRNLVKGKNLKDLAKLSSLLGGCYPALSNCMGWTNRLANWESDPEALLHTRYLPEGKQYRASVFIGTVDGQEVRMDIYKIARNELKCRPVSGKCYQEKICYKIKARPDKPAILKILKKENKIEFELEVITDVTSNVFVGLEANKIEFELQNHFKEDKVKEEIDLNSMSESVQVNKCSSCCFK